MEGSAPTKPHFLVVDGAAYRMSGRLLGYGGAACAFIALLLLAISAGTHSWVSDRSSDASQGPFGACVGAGSARKCQMADVSALKDVPCPNGGLKVGARVQLLQALCIIGILFAAFAFIGPVALHAHAACTATIVPTLRHVSSAIAVAVVTFIGGITFAVALGLFWAKGGDKSFLLCDTPFPGVYNTSYGFSLGAAGTAAAFLACALSAAAAVVLSAHDDTTAMAAGGASPHEPFSAFAPTAASAPAPATATRNPIDATAVAPAGPLRQQHPSQAAPRAAGPPPEGGDWEWDAASGYYWSEARYMYYDPASAMYNDPKSNKWYDPATGKWES